MLKKITAIIFAMLFLFNLASAKTMELTLGEKELLVSDDGKVITSELKDAPYINEKGSTMISLDFVKENFGAKCEWNKEKDEAVLSFEETTIVFGKDDVKLNGEVVSQASLKEEKEGNLFVPLRFLAEALGYNVSYSQALGKVILDNSEAILKAGNAVLNYTEFKALFDIFYAFAHDDAIKSGATEQELKFYAYQAAAETAISFVVMYNAFPNVYMDQEDIKFIKEAIETDGKLISFSLPGLFSLIQEKYYLTKGTPILKNLANSPEFEKYYNENYICAKHILMDDEAQAEELLEKVKNGEDFDALINEYGMDPGMENYPEGYIFTKGEMVEEFEVAAFALKDGEVSGIVKSPYGYHIIKKEALPEMPDYIKEYMAKNKANEILSKAESASLLVEESLLTERLGLSE